MFAKPLIAVLAVLATAPLINAITVTGPSSSKWWVFGTSNQITWTFNQGDPTPVSITITNPSSNSLNGAFSISEFVTVSDESFTVTNVTIKPATGYVVNFVNSQNTSEIYASSSPFEVKAQGSAPYGATVYTVLSLSVSGTVTETFTLVETSYASSATPTPTLTGTAASSVSSTSTAAAAATATLLHKDNSDAASIKGAGTAAFGLMGAVAGVALLL